MKTNCWTTEARYGLFIYHGLHSLLGNGDRTFEYYRKFLPSVAFDEEGQALSVGPKSQPPSTCWEFDRCSMDSRSNLASLRIGIESRSVDAFGPRPS